MTNKTTMPEPVAYPSDEWVEAFFGRPDETGYYYFRGDFGNIAYRFQLGAQASNLITTKQAEAYANGRVKQVLDEAAMILKSNAESCNIDTAIILRANAEAILALIPKEPPCET